MPRKSRLALKLGVIKNGGLINYFVVLTVLKLCQVKSQKVAFDLDKNLLFYNIFYHLFCAS